MATKLRGNLLIVEASGIPWEKTPGMWVECSASSRASAQIRDAKLEQTVMASRRVNKEREDRIENEIVVDAHDSEQWARGWYYYLDDQMHFPFTAKCIAARPISPLRVGDDVEVTGMAPEDECEHEMFVMMRWEKKGLAVPLAQLKPGIEADDQTRQAIEDWHYWVKQGYEFEPYCQDARP